MAVLLERISAELSLIRAHGWDAAWAKALPFCRTEIISPAGYQPTPDDDLLHDILLKFLVRGERSFTTYFAERAIISCYGKLLPIRGVNGKLNYPYYGKQFYPYQGKQKYP